MNCSDNYEVFIEYGDNEDDWWNDKFFGPYIFIFTNTTMHKSRECSLSTMSNSRHTTTSTKRPQITMISTPGMEIMKTTERIRTTTHTKTESATLSELALLYWTLATPADLALLHWTSAELRVEALQGERAGCLTEWRETEDQVHDSHVTEGFLKQRIAWRLATLVMT